MARDITEGRANRAIAVDVGIVTGTSLWQNTSIAYDVAIGGLPFVLATTDGRQYIRQTAPFRKDQFDNGAEPGEQSLTGWWLRSQSSFHTGTGIKFFDPATSDINGHYRYTDSKGVNVWTPGQVTLLKDVTTGHNITGAIQSNGRAFQQARSIRWSNTNGVLLHDGYDVDKIPVDTPGTPVHFIDYNAGVGVSPVYGICDDGTFAYWVTNTVGAGGKLVVYKKPLTGSSASTADEVTMFTSPSVTVANAVMEYVKDRIIMCANNSVYEFSSSAGSMPSALYTHPSSSYVYTSIAASGSAIYTAGYNGIQSTIHKYTLSSSGTLPTLTSAIVAAELPVGEVVHKIYYYLGFMMIGTSKGVRAAVVENDGSLNYGPLIVQTSQPCYDFAARDRYVWCATGVDGDAGVIRIDLGTELETLRFAYANDLYVAGVNGHQTTTCAFADGTERLIFATTNNGTTDGAVYAEHATNLATSGYLQTGYIRFGTLEPKNYKRLLGRGDFTYGSVTMYTVKADGTTYDHITYDNSVPSVEVTTTQPEGSHEYLAYKFAFNRDGSDSTKGPVFQGYQAKATIATPRQRLIRFYVYCMDVETDKYNVQFGYAGRGFEKMLALEDMEESGDIVMFQDLNTGENRQVQIELVQLANNTPPDRGASNFGGIVEVTVRTV